MNALLAKQVVKLVVPAMAGALGTYLATAWPTVYAAVCGG